LSNNFPLVFFFANLGTLVVIGFGGALVMDGSLSIGELIAFNAYLAFLLQPILTIGFLAAAISRAGASATRIFDVLDAPSDIQDRPGARPLPPVAGEVIYDQVSFRYPGVDADVLCDVSFSVQPGQTVAILGTTGAGKSTLVNLLPRFYDVTRGSVRIDGYDVRDVSLASLRGQISIVLQEALLFGGSVRDNIAYGKPDATQAEIEDAARAAQAHEFIAELPQGYEALVGERGIGLSGGQRQRLAIARALLVDPCLLILDDSTSAVDTETEAAIREALDRLIRARRRTVFVIAQRVSTVRDADLILVLDDGGVAAQGRHEDLLRDSELYNQILGSQLRDDPVAAATTASEHPLTPASSKAPA
jgi:ATP-binding cassette subfamily B protein